MSSSGCNRSTEKAASSTGSSSAASRSTRQCNVWWDCPAAPSFREGPILYPIEHLGAFVTGFRRPGVTEGERAMVWVKFIRSKKGLQYLESWLKSGMERKMTAPKIIGFVGMGLVAKHVNSDFFFKNKENLYFCLVRAWERCHSDVCAPSTHRGGSLHSG